MNEHNYAYLRDQLQYAGFGDKPLAELREKMATPRSFSLVYGKEFGEDAVAAILRFKKSTESDLIFFNNYTLHLSGKGIEQRQQTFHLKGMSGIPLDKAYNLLSGRAVLQEFPDRKGWEFSWVKLDLSQKDRNNNYPFRQYKDDFGYTFSKAVTKLSIFPMDAFSAEKIIGSLEHGELRPTLFRHDNKDVKLFITYDPATKEVMLFNKDMKRLGQDEMKAFIKPAESLLPKKRVRENKKGLRI